MKKRKSLSILVLISMMFCLFVLPQEINAVDYVAEMDGNKYATLTEAIEAVPTDNSQKVIKLLKTVDNGTGFKITAGQNIVLDFNGFNYDASNPLVGSKGTETNGCQLLKGSTVVFKNGTLRSSSSKILIQNYSNLTLQDMMIDTTMGNARYSMSNNNGIVNIMGNTSIKSNHVAFDMCWAPNFYPDGTQITVNTTGTITGDIELGLWNSNDDTNNVKSTLNIKNVNHNGKFSVNSKLTNQLKIEGGTFTSEDASKYLSENNKLFLVNSVYKVAPKATGITLSKTEVQLAKGTTTTLTAILAPVGTLDKATWTSDNENIVTVDANGVVTAHAKGTTEITAAVGDKSAKCTLRVYEIETPVIPTTPSTGPENGKTEVVLDKEASQVLENSIKDLIDNIDTTTAISEETKASIKSAITDGSTISVEPKVEAVDTTTIDKKVLAKIEETLGTKDKVVQYFELSMNLIVDGREVGTINELTGKVKFTITIDESLIEEGKEFYMIRYHEDGSVEKIEGTLVGNQFTFETDKFSTYALAYEIVSGVDTGDTSNPSMLLGLMGLAILVIGKVIYTKKVNG